MPPKKQPKLDKVTLVDRSSKSAAKGKQKVKGKKQSQTKPKKKPAKQDRYENPELLRPSTPILQAASGAGIKSTAQLKEITRTTRAQAKILQSNENCEDPNLPVQESDNEQGNSDEINCSSSGESSESSSSGSDSDSDS